MTFPTSPRKPLLRLSIAATIATVLAAPAAAQDRAEPIILGQVGLSFYAVVGGVVDMLAAAWLPSGHGALFEPVEAATFTVAPIYEDAAFFWVVPSYVPEDQVSSIADLAKPEVAERMPETIVSLPEATGLTTGGRRVMDAYGLTDAGYELVAASPAAWLGAFTQAVENGEWVVFPLWQPQWVNAVHDVRPLEEPEGAYAAPDTAYLIGHEGLRDKLDAGTMALLRGIRFDVTDVTEMDRLMNVEGMTAREAAQAWMSENVETIDGWGGES